jgi:hypothetical protein
VPFSLIYIYDDDVAMANNLFLRFFLFFTTAPTPLSKSGSIGYEKSDIFAEFWLYLLEFVTDFDVQTLFKKISKF